jgi:hypothetical protein
MQRTQWITVSHNVRKESKEYNDLFRDAFVFVAVFGVK